MRRFAFRTVLALSCAAIALAGCVTTAPVPEIRHQTCPPHSPENPCVMPTRESDTPVADAFGALGCLVDYLGTYREDWEACAE